MIEITPEAAKHICQLVAEKKSNESQGLRLAIEKGGCAGLQYIMTLETAHKEDLIITQEGALIFIDAPSVAQLDNCILGYEEGLTGSGFRILNPQAVRSCGCGTSFEPKEKTSRSHE
ncbi:MAG: iron-sulfur cluster assembly accessory protein [Verrucomicrobia bacterium]|jgi:iron-sulfur cluster assembly protein|nr:MAG: iron-sulfur cluster assembly accessory protein [Verrucomicrobiota bacterium]MDH4470654.1 iron-sulfur cluster assembly accessory protein [Verrucomicrobiae bacterium]